MKRSNLQFCFVLLASITLAACGGSSGGSDTTPNADTTPPAPTPTPTPQPTPVVVQSADLVADKDFSFRIDQEVTLVIQAGDGMTGVAHIYSATDATSPEDDQRPDYLSRVTTVRPDMNANATFNYTGTEGILWVEWLPTATSAQDSLQKVAISSDQSTYYVDVQ